MPLYLSSGSDKWKILPRMLFSKEQDRLTSATRVLLVSECLGEHIILPISTMGPFPHLIIYVADPLDEVAHGWICGAKAPIQAVVYPLTIQKYIDLGSQ